MKPLLITIAAFFKIEKIEDDKLYCSFTKAQEKYGLLSLDQILIFKKIEEDSEDAFSYTKPEFNQWRIKPKQAEEFDKIKVRVKGALAYSSLILKLAIKNKSKSVTNATFNLPFDYYSNGIRLKPFGKCSGWQAIFYDEQDALLGYSIITKAMEAPFTIPQFDTPMETNEFIFTELVKEIN